MTSAAPAVADYVAQVEAWIEHAEPYTGARCGFPCPICDALGAVPASTLVVSASGNWDAQTCPACFDRVVGVGFHRTGRVEVGGSVFRTSELPVSKGPVGRAELLVEEPPGFVGTSFAAPLLSGLGALVPEPAILAELARMSGAMIRSRGQYAVEHWAGRAAGGRTQYPVPRTTPVCRGDASISQALRPERGE